MYLFSNFSYWRNSSMLWPQLWSFYHPTTIIVFHLILCKEHNFFQISSDVASLRYMWAGLSCHTRRLVAGSMLIAVTAARLPLVDGVCRKMCENCPDHHKTHCISYHIMFAIISNTYTRMYVYSYIAPQCSIMSNNYAHRRVKVCFCVNIDFRNV